MTKMTEGEIAEKLLALGPQEPAVLVYALADEIYGAELSDAISFREWMRRIAARLQIRDRVTEEIERNARNGDGNHALRVTGRVP